MKLVKPSLKYKEEAIKYIKEFYDFNSSINGTGSLDKYLKEQTYEDWLEKIEQDENYPPEGKVKASTYFLVENDKIIGMINIRHSLNDYLLQHGGHIGYSIRPTERRKGYAKENLYLGLEKSNELGIEKALVTADDDNIASYKTIEALGGILENKVIFESEIPTRRYWIDVKKSLEENNKILQRRL